MKVLIIDDEFWTRDSIKRLGEWERLGIERISEAEDGLSGLQIVDEEQPDIIITDMKMRGMDGIALLQRLNESHPFIRKIVISGYEDFSYMKQAILSRVDEYILKPVKAEDLNQALEKAINELQASRGILGVRHFDKELLKTVMEYKQYIVMHFHDFHVAALKVRFNDLQQKLVSAGRLQAGMNNNLYKQFMVLLEEQTSLLGYDLATIANDGITSLYVTDETPIPQWVEHLAEAYESVIVEIVSRRKNKNRLDIREVQTFLDHYFAEPVQLETLAGQFFISKEHLSRSFKQETGLTVMDYIILKRVEKAKQLLQDPLVQIKSAAEAVGYADLTYFYRIFKKITGVTPSQFRQVP